MNQTNGNKPEEVIMPVGGQAVIEGVMMRSPDKVATAVRRMNGKIELKVHEFQSLIQKKKWLNIPIFRGAVTLVEVMVLGIKHLNFSADIAMQDAELEEEKKAKENGKKIKKKKKESKGMSTLSAFATVAFALSMGILIFFFGPLLITTKLFSIEQQAFAFNLVAGIIRICIFLIYIYLISLMKDVKRLFRYHGAEHKIVYTFESYEPLTVLGARPFTTLHPRCGTSFLVMVMFVSLLFFSLFDSVIMLYFGKINLVIRTLTHIPLVPLVGGLSYEAIKASAKKPDHPIVKSLITPGLWLQRITTQEPDDDMLEVAIIALKAALGEKYAHLVNTGETEKVAENIVNS